MVIRKALLTLAASLFLLASGTVPAKANDAFCQGYKNGYFAGYCYKQQFCMKPMAPMCPFPGFGEDTYSEGYNRGFLDGMAAQN